VKIYPAVIFVLMGVKAHLGLLLEIKYERRQDSLPYLQRGRP
jgi:hypothetical protein